jgi:hypothetical protein
MTRLLQLSVVIVALLVARRVLYAWLKQPDTLWVLLREALNALLAYFVYVMVGMALLSAVAGRGFGEGSQFAAALITLGGAVYAAVGIGGLWYYLGKADARRKKK